MSEHTEPAATTRKNPLIWIALLVLALIVFVFASGDRGATLPASLEKPEATTSGNIDRSLLIPPGMRARQYIEELRADGKPYPFAGISQKAQDYMQEGSLADAHLLYFFAAREDHLPSIMKLGEMSDPTLFRAENSLLDHADVIQAYKWYQKAAALGEPAAGQRVDNLRQWASDQAEAGDPHARQLLLNFK